MKAIYPIGTGMLACALSLPFFAWAGNKNMDKNTSIGNGINAVSYVQKQAMQIWYDGTRWFSSGNNCVYRLDQGSYQVSGKDPAGNWSVVFLNDQEGAVPQLNDNKLTFSNERQTIEYINNGQGLRQNFIINKRPLMGNGLCVHLNLQTDLEYQLVNRETLQFSRNGKTILSYDDLHVWDANHKTLDAHFELINNSLSIIVDDRNATYPVTIDPLSHTPEWTSSANGVLSSLPAVQINSSLYGYKVKYVGDVNNDGFGDVAVSAPGLADIITGSGSLSSVGAVYIFHGSASGISSVPSNVLQPNTAVAGALFGFSVEGRDLDNDGFSDLIIGAPLDQETIAVGLGTASGTVGKVYVYSGASMGTSNPSYLLSLSLTTTGVLNSVNIINNALFGFSVGVADDMNGDTKPEILVGSPTFAEGSVGTGLGLQTGGAFVFYSNINNTFSTSSTSLLPPTFSELGITIPGVTDINGLLFGYSVDGAGDYNLDGNRDVIIGAPAGVDLTSFGGAFTGQVLGGSAYIYFDQAGSAGAGDSAGVRLQAEPTGLLSSLGNLYGFEVRGLRDTSGARTGNVAVGAPTGGMIPNALGLTIQTGQVGIFPALFSPGNPKIPDQVLESPRSTSLLFVLNTLDVNVLFGASLDNAYDVNCDGLPDMVVGEPLSSGATLFELQVAATGGSAYVYLGIPGGLFAATPLYSVNATYGSDFLSANLIPMFGSSVSGMPGPALGQTEARVLVGAPGSALDFDGVLNLGSTLGTLFNFAAGDNGPGKAYAMFFDACGITLPVSLIRFSGEKVNGTSILHWSVAAEKDVKEYVIERSIDGKNWNSIGTVTATGHAEYEFTDVQPAAAENLYRLSMKSTGSNAQYSQVVRLDFSGNNSSLVYPNPAHDMIYVNPLHSGKISIRMYNTTGSVVAALMLDGQAGEAIRLSRAELGNAAPGTYWLLITDESGDVKKTALVLD